MLLHTISDQLSLMQAKAGSNAHKAIHMRVHMCRFAGVPGHVNLHMWVCTGAHFQVSKCKGMGAQVHLNEHWDNWFNGQKRDRLTLTFINTVTYNIHTYCNLNFPWYIWIFGITEPLSQDFERQKSTGTPRFRDLLICRCKPQLSLRLKRCFPSFLISPGVTAPINSRCFQFMASTSYTIQASGSTEIHVATFTAYKSLKIWQVQDGKPWCIRFHWHLISANIWLKIAHMNLKYAIERLYAYYAKNAYLSKWTSSVL